MALDNMKESGEATGEITSLASLQAALLFAKPRSQFSEGYDRHGGDCAATVHSAMNFFTPAGISRTWMIIGKCNSARYPLRHALGIDDPGGRGPSPGAMGGAIAKTGLISACWKSGYLGRDDCPCPA